MVTILFFLSMYSKNKFANNDCERLVSIIQIVRLPNCLVTKLSGYQIVRLPNCKVTKLSGYQIISSKLVKIGSSCFIL